MRYSVLLYFTILISCLASCKTNEVGAEDQVDSSLESISNIEEVIRFSRGACFGQCPIFELAIFNDGKMYLEGRRFLKNIGTFSNQLSESKYNDLIKKVELMEVYKMHNTYANEFSDVPMLNIKIRLNGKEKIISGQMGFPEELQNFFNELDVMAASDQWTKENEMGLKYSRANGVIKEEIILQLKKDADIKAFLKPFGQFNTVVLQELSKSSNTFLITYDSKKVRSSSMLQMCKQNELVENAEFNQIVSLRNGEN